jgi:hypothetical protein
MRFADFVGDGFALDRVQGARNGRNVHASPQSDDGERIVGRVVAPSKLSRLCRNLGIDHVEAITSDHALRVLTHGSSMVGLAGDMTLRRVRVMNDSRSRTAPR